MATKETEAVGEAVVTANLPPLGGQPERVATRTLADVEAEEEKDFKVMRKHLDEKEALLLKTLEALKSSHLKVCSFRNWLGYELSEVNQQREVLK